MSKLHLYAAAAAAVSVLALSAHGAMSQEVKVGSVAAVTGPIPDLIAPIVVARNLAAKHINEQGGLFDGQALNLVLADGQCDGKAGVDAGQKVVNVNQVVAVVGASCTGETVAMAQSVTIPAGIVSISESASAPVLTTLEDNDLVFRTTASDAYQGRALAEVAIAQGYKSLAITYANDDYNGGLAEVFEAAFTELGGTVTASEVHEPDKQSYRSELATLAGAGEAEALALFAYYGSSGISIIRNSLENGLFEKFLLADGMFDDSVIEQIGAENLEGNVHLTQAASDFDSETYKLFADAYSAETDNDPAASYAAQGYDATFVMALAIEKAGSADRTLIREALREVANAPGTPVRPTEWAKAKELIAAGEDIDYQGASGPIDFDENGDVAGVYSVNVVGADGTWNTSLLR